MLQIRPKHGFFSEARFLRDTLRKKCPYSELLWSVISRIRAVYGEVQTIRRDTQFECGRIRTKITPNTDNFLRSVSFNKFWKAIPYLQLFSIFQLLL